MSDAQERQNTQDAENIEYAQNTQATPPPATEGGRLAELEARNTELESQLTQAKQEASDNWNRFVRERADVENIRKRQERMLTERVQYQRKALLQKFLGVLDNVDRALAYYETMDKQQLQQTLRMVQWQMNEVMRSEGLNQVPTIGEAFNPYVHEAIEAVENSDQPEGTIVEEVQKGYTLGDETLRPARVKVSMGNKQ
jgi:molecular chaperone GrpE